MMIDPQLLRVAFPRACNTQQTTPKHATRDATGMQQTSLKALARNALGRNTPCNTPATEAEKTRNKQAEKTPPFVAQFSPIRDRLLNVARELGLPDKIVLELPASEIAATADQYAGFTSENGEELGRRLLVFYLRSLAGIEPALPDSLAAHNRERNTP